jgi:tetratricopeptide (TPR) repeat protein
MNNRLDLDQQRKIGEIKRRVNRQRTWFSIATLVCMVGISGTYTWLVRPMLRQSTAGSARQLLLMGDVVVAILMIAPIVAIIFLLMTGRLRVLLQPDRVTYYVPLDAAASAPSGPQTDPSQETMLLSWLFLYGGTIIGFMLIFGLEQFVETTWPAIPSWVPRVGIAVPMIILIALLNLGRAWLARSSTVTTDQFWKWAAASLRQFVPSVVLLALLGLMAVLILSGLLPENLSESILAALRAASRWLARNALVGLVALVAVMVAFSLFVPWYVEVALKQGHYDQALRRLNRLGFLLGRPEAKLFFQGSILLFAGQNAEAERLLDESARRDSSPDHSAFVLENRGYARLRQEKYELAQQDFETAIRLRPEGHGAYSGLAEVLLWQGKDARHAVELAEHALSNLERLVVARRVSAERRAEYWSVKAWALALAGIQVDADRALQTAFQLARQDYIPVLALIYYRASRVYRLREDRGKAREMLQRAQSLDPTGHAGSLAARALKTG